MSDTNETGGVLAALSNDLAGAVDKPPPVW